MDILDRLLAHDAWTTRQLLLACQALTDSKLDQEFEIDHGSLRLTFLHIIVNLEVWIDLLCERPVQRKTGESISDLLERLSLASRDFSGIAHKVIREKRTDDFFLDTLDKPPQRKTFGGAIGHVITHNMHHRAHIIELMEKVGLNNHIEGDLLGWEFQTFGWR